MLKKFDVSINYFVSAHVYNPCLDLVFTLFYIYLPHVINFVTVKLPQILKIFQAKSGAGLSMPSLCLNLAALTTSNAYGFNSGFPFR